LALAERLLTPCPDSAAPPPPPPAGHELREDEQAAEQKRLLLERFQAEVRGRWRCSGW
jgi:hypothetical protein